jgi:ribosomal protein L11 methylase PrmA
MLQRKPDIGYIPTAHAVVEAMFALAGLTGDDILYDLGSGDGRIAIAAAQQFGTRGVGIDIDPERIREANENARRAGVSNLVEFRQQDLFESNFSEATVVILYLLPHLNLRLRPQLFRQMKPGTRVVSHDFNMDDWTPEQTMKIETEEESTLYYWVIPEDIPKHLCADSAAL